MKTLRKYLPNNFSLFLLVCSLVCFPSWVMAQTIKLSGMVTDESRNPLPSDEIFVVPLPDSETQN